MRRREFIAFVGGATIGWPYIVVAQQPERVRIIGFLWLSEATPPTRSLETAAPSRQLYAAAVTKRLHELGWTAGHNVQYEHRFADKDQLRASAKELVELKPDVIVAVTSPPTAALFQETRTIPIVFVSVTDPVGQGFITSVARPGGNVTGFTVFEFSMGGKWLELLREVAPQVSRTAVMFFPATQPVYHQMVQSVEIASRSLASQVITTPMQGPDEIEPIIKSLTREPNTGAIVLPDISTTLHRSRLIEMAQKYRLPTVYPFGFFARDGGLISYGFDITDQFLHAASYVDRILRGAKPGELPAQEPTKFELIINLKTANALGITIPPTLLARADEVIE
jgi:putative ABC transport system substrate-binding protein